MNILEDLLSVFKDEYYVVPIMGFFEFVAIVTGLLWVRGDRTRLFFVGYLIFDFLILIGLSYVEVSPAHTRDDYRFLISLSNPLISCCELLVYYYYFGHIIKNQTIIRLMRLLRIVFIAVVAVFVISKFDFITERYLYVSNLIGALGFSFLLPPCFSYFYEILRDDSLVNLPQRPSFWIVTGIFFYSVLSIPFFLINTLLNASRYEYWDLLKVSLFYIPFTINFIFLTKAFLCRRPLTI